MKIITLDEAKRIKFNHLSVALGTFDGLHIGHLVLIDAAKNHDGQSGVFTFDSLPMDVFDAHHKALRLFTLKEKIAAFEKTGIDYLCISSFDQMFADMDKADFEKLLSDIFTPQKVIAGYNYSYGKQAQGNVETLSDAGKNLGFGVEVISPVIYDGQPVSATRIRQCLSAGDIRTANALLGYSYSAYGEVVRGKGLGKQLGFPTANIDVEEGKMVPKNGVYGVDVIVGKNKYKGICNIGVNPTIAAGNKLTVEAHMIDMSYDIYGQTITVIFNKRIRGEKRFSDVEALKSQIRKDITCL